MFLICPAVSILVASVHEACLRRAAAHLTKQETQNGIGECTTPCRHILQCSSQSHLYMPAESGYVHCESKRSKRHKCFRLIEQRNVCTTSTCTVNSAIKYARRSLPSPKFVLTLPKYFLAFSSVSSSAARPVRYNTPISISSQASRS